MPKIAKNTDLTKLEGDPGSRAQVGGLPEKFSVRVRAGKRKAKLTARTLPRSPLGTAIATVPVILCGCIVMAVLALVVRAPVWVSCCGLLVPVLFYLGLRGLSHRAPDQDHLG